jgi:AcrR family transcriptional regulator
MVTLRAQTPAPHMRDKLAQCAFDLFAERGIRAVTLDAVAAKAGVTKGSLYWHYRSKKELILAAAGVYYRDWLQRAHTAIASTRSPLEQIRRVWRMSVEMCLFDRAKRVFSTEIFALSIHDSEIRASWSQFYDSVRALFIGLIQTAVNTGHLHVRDLERAADWMLASFEGIKHRAVFQPQICTPAERDAMVGGFMEILAAISAAEDSR